MFLIYMPVCVPHTPVIVSFHFIPIILGFTCPWKPGHLHSPSLPASYVRVEGWPPSGNKAGERQLEDMVIGKWKQGKEGGAYGRLNTRRKMALSQMIRYGGGGGQWVAYKQMWAHKIEKGVLVA